jgi:hypothetical protein
MGSSRPALAWSGAIFEVDFSKSKCLWFGESFWGVAWQNGNKLDNTGFSRTIFGKASEQGPIGHWSLSIFRWTSDVVRQEDGSWLRQCRAW